MRDEQDRTLSQRAASPRPAGGTSFGQPIAVAGGERDPHGVTFLQRTDGSSITISTQPGGFTGDRVVLLRLQSPLLDAVNAVYLRPAEADRLADGLAHAAELTRRGIRAGGAGAGIRAGGEEPHDEPAGQLVVVAGQGTSAQSLRTALDDLPPGASLLDFGADVDVSLVFALPATGASRGPG
ncbi:hypothetical protein [Pseudofrankia sp. DC12]|uniref:hypothetical protein n=1 Tax=Pseudofrankia sp. DC12 TaxID=683315 RepID=UPI0005F7E16B|nr:hypothetical protein [Pseudofrankia sp. DC12]